MFNVPNGSIQFIRMDYMIKALCKSNFYTANIVGVEIANV